MNEDLVNLVTRLYAKRGGLVSPMNPHPPMRM